MFQIVMFGKRELAAPPVHWIKTVRGTTVFYWPLYGLSFKLKNLVPIPLDSDVEEKKNWLIRTCEILLNGDKFATYELAEAEIGNIIDNSKRNVSTTKIQENNYVEVEELREVGVQTEVDVIPGEVQEVPGEVQEVPGEVIDVPGEAHELQSPVVEKEVEVEEATGLKASVADKQIQAALEDGENGEGSKKQTSNSEILGIDSINDFNASEVTIQTESKFEQLKEYYISINEKEERKFFDQFVKKTFTERFFLDYITFKPDKKRKHLVDYVNFEDTLLYTCLKKSMEKKLNLYGLTDSEMKKIIVTNFQRIKHTLRARN